MSWGLSGWRWQSPSGPDEPPASAPARADAQQTREAVKIAQGAMVELRKKTEGASTPEADRREYVVGVELLSSNESTTRPAEDSPARGEGKAAHRQAARAAERWCEIDQRRVGLGAAGDRDVLSIF